jgi:predicted CoA-substrate-specific enzyme activase
MSKVNKIFKIEDVLDGEMIGKVSDDTVVGLDLGSRAGKGILIANGKIYTAITPTGVYMQQTADTLLGKLLKQAEIEKSEIKSIVGTGYGRISLKFGDLPSNVITEISCHAMGSHYLNSRVRTIVDIGGQDSKAIKVDHRNGKVIEFVMNDKCAAGTGRFLEKVANFLEITVEQLGEEALNANVPADVSSQCVVFAESEVISLKAKGIKRANIAAGIHIATARRVKNLLNRIGIEPELVFSGGVSNNLGMKKALEELLGYKISNVKLDTIYAGALGAAIFAQKSVAADSGSEKSEELALLKA